MSWRVSISKFANTCHKIFSSNEFLKKEISICWMQMLLTNDWPQEKLFGGSLK
jgi:hypothetical protein